jgi:hypothetical protein
MLRSIQTEQVTEIMNIVGIMMITGKIGWPAIPIATILETSAAISMLRKIK